MPVAKPILRPRVRMGERTSSEETRALILPFQPARLDMDQSRDTHGYLTLKRVLIWFISLSQSCSFARNSLTLFCCS